MTCAVVHVCLPGRYPIKVDVEIRKQANVGVAATEASVLMSIGLLLQTMGTGSVVVVANT